jgi:hypothetical protein
MDELRADLGVTRRRRTLLIIVLAIVLVLAGGTGYLAGRSHPRIVTRTVARVEHRVTVRTVTRWRTRTATRAGSSAGTTPCLEKGGTVVPAAGGAAAGEPGLTTCSLQVEPDEPAAAGDRLVITAPDGTSGSYQLISPSG